MIRRRFILTGLSAAASLGTRSAAGAVPRLVAIDWTAAESLIALGATPVAISDSGYFASRMPFDLPPGIADIGPFWEVNLEYLARIAPDAVLAPSWALVSTPALARIAPVLIVPETVRTDRFDLAAQVLAQAADAAGHAPASARSLTRATEARLAGIGAGFAERSGPVLVAVPDISGRLFTVYGENSLPDAVLRRLGLTNAWRGPASAAGVFRAGIEHLMAMPATTAILLVEIAAMRPRVERALNRSALWQAVPAVRAGRMRWIGQFYPVGGIVSARHLGEVLAGTLAEMAAG